MEIKLNQGSKFLFSLFSKEGPAALAATQLAQQLRLRGVSLLASGGTKTFLENRGHEVTDVEEFSGYGAVLGHRVVTLVPQVHGGLLAETEHIDELMKLKWPLIDGICCTFYDLEAALKQDGADYNSVNNAVDIGGPAMVRSANKGGRIALTDEETMKVLTRMLESDAPVTPEHVHFFQARASRSVANYCRIESEWREWVMSNALNTLAGFPIKALETDCFGFSCLPGSSVGGAKFFQ